MDKKITRQIDLQVSGLRVREVEGEQRSRTIEGYAVVFGVRSVNLTPWSSDREVYEIMERDSITNDLLNRSDIVLTAFHDNTAILGRWRQGKGTLKLWLDERGMRFECTLGNTARADELLSAIDRGDIDGMSFAFTADEEDNVNGVLYEKTGERTAEGKVVWLRRVKKVTGLYDVTIAGHPAYPQTSVEAREAIDAFLNEHLREDKADDPEDKTDDMDDTDDEEKDRACGGDKDRRACGGDGEKDRACGDDEEAKKKAEEEEAAKREAEEQAKREQEERELEEQAERARQTRELRQRMQRMKLSNRKF